MRKYIPLRFINAEVLAVTSVDNPHNHLIYNIYFLAC